MTIPDQNAEPAVQNEAADTPPPPPPEAKNEEAKLDVYTKAAVWLAYVLAFLATILLAIYTCTWLGEYEYNVQIARHVCILLWLTFLTACYNFPKPMSDYFIFPKSGTTTYFIIGLAYIVTMLLFLADPTLDLLYKGNKGVKYHDKQGTRTLPKLDPRKLFNGVIGLYTGIGVIGAGFWTCMLYRWVSGADN